MQFCFELNLLLVYVALLLAVIDGPLRWDKKVTSPHKKHEILTSLK